MPEVRSECSACVMRIAWEMPLSFPTHNPGND